MPSAWILRAGLLVVCLVMFTAPAQAQRSTTRGFSLGAHLVGASLTVEDDDPVGGGGLGLHVGYGFNRRLTGYIEADGIVFDVENPDLEGEWTMGHVDIGLRYNFSNSLRAWVPFLDGAIGGRRVTVDDARSEGENVGEVTFSGGALSIGGGVSFYPSEKFALQTLVKFTGGTFEQVDVGDISVRNLDIDASSFRFKFGVSWWP